MVASQSLGAMHVLCGVPHFVKRARLVCAVSYDYDHGHGHGCCCCCDYDYYSSTSDSTRSSFVRSDTPKASSRTSYFSACFASRLAPTIELLPVGCPSIRDAGKARTCGPLLSPPPPPPPLLLAILPQYREAI